MKKEDRDVLLSTAQSLLIQAKCSIDDVLIEDRIRKVIALLERSLEDR